MSSALSDEWWAGHAAGLIHGKSEADADWVSTLEEVLPGGVESSPDAVAAWIAERFPLPASEFGEWSQLGAVEEPSGMRPGSAPDQSARLRITP